MRTWRKGVVGCVVLGAAVLLAGVRPASAQTVVNGDFDAQDFPAWPGYLALVEGTNTNPATIMGWTASGTNIGINPVSRPGPYPCCGADPFSPVTGPETGEFAFLQVSGATPTATLSQTITGFTPGSTYELRYRDGNRDGDSGDGATLTATIGSLVNATTPTSADWTDRSASFVATGASMTLTFTAANTAGNDQTITIDQVAIVPEPSAGLLLGGLAATILLRRRRVGA